MRKMLLLTGIPDKESEDGIDVARFRNEGSGDVTMENQRTGEDLLYLNRDDVCELIQFLASVLLYDD